MRLSDKAILLTLLVAIAYFVLRPWCGRQQATANVAVLYWSMLALDTIAKRNA